MTKFKIGEKYKTRCGYDAEIYAIKEGQPCSLLGAVFEDGRWVPVTWYHSGQYVISLDKHNLDLMPPAPEKVKVWVALFRDKEGNIFSGSSTKSEQYLSRLCTEIRVSDITCIEIEVKDDNGK